MFNREVDVLSFLNCLKHPNTVELLASYIFRNHHYLLFPLAIPACYSRLQLPILLDCSLAKKLRMIFKTTPIFLLSLSGLASIVEELHIYESEALHVSLLGCHHDLKPRIVLVVEARFLLADFGLSKVKNLSKRVQIIFRGR